jgi:hypothetical protein
MNSASREDMSVDTQLSFSVFAPTVSSLPRVPTDIDMTTSLSKSFFATGASSTWDAINSDVKKLDAKVSLYEDLLKKIDSRLDRLESMESKIDLLLSKLEGSSRPEESASYQPDNMLFQPGKALYNQLSVSKKEILKCIVVYLELI